MRVLLALLPIDGGRGERICQRRWHIRLDGTGKRVGEHDRLVVLGIMRGRDHEVGLRGASDWTTDRPLENSSLLGRFRRREGVGGVKSGVAESDVEGTGIVASARLRDDLNPSAARAACIPRRTGSWLILTCWTADAETASAFTSTPSTTTVAPFVPIALASRKRDNAPIDIVVEDRKIVERLLANRDRIEVRVCLWRWSRCRRR